MSAYFIVTAVFLPIAAGLLYALLPFGKNGKKTGGRVYLMVSVCLTSVLVFALIAMRPTDSFVMLELMGKLAFELKIDGLSCVFGGLVAGLWPLATLYAFEYMAHVGGEKRFFTLYTMTYGVTLGIAFSANLVTMYLFYEFLTLITVPLVMHEWEKRSIKAGIKYLGYSMAGAASAFMGMLILAYYSDPSLTFKYGGFVTKIFGTGYETELCAAVLMLFFGFGVKAAVFPFHGWLPSAGVAPTPVTALLHAVAVVKSGVFAVMRVLWFCVSPAAIRGSFLQTIMMSFAIFTIVFGSSMAVKEQHFKRRLAYSTVSNLSYILFGVTLLTPAGLTGSLMHMLFHGVMKITLFYVAGAVMCRTEKEYIPDLRGFGPKMPVTFLAFTVGSLALFGMPLLPGFISKWNLATAAVEVGTVPAVLGIGALLISAFLTAVYLMSIVTIAYFPGKDFDLASVEQVSDPGICMKLPFIVLMIAMVVLGLFSTPLQRALEAVANGLL